MDKLPNWLKTAWMWVIEPLLHATWGHGLLLLVSTFLIGAGGFTLGESRQKQHEREGLDQLVSILIDRYSTRMPEKNSSKAQYNLAGTWSYTAKDRSRNLYYSGDVKIIQKNSGRLEFVEGHRKEITDASSGYKTSTERPIDWKSLWAQVTPESLIRVEYVINLEEGKALGYFVLNPPQPPFKELKGYYYILRPSLIFGEITLTKT